MNTETPTEELEVAEARSAAYSLIARSLRYPDSEMLVSLRDPTRWTAWPTVVQAIDPGSGEKLQAVQKQITSAQSVAPLEEAWVRVFGHAVRGSCPPYELEYGRREIIQQASELADIAGFYSAFGMELTEDGNERADHAAVECEFMSVLAAKEAHAIGCEDAEGLDVLRNAQRAFLADHLGRWLPALARRIVDADPRGFYGALGEFASSFVAVECDRFDVPRGPEFVELRPADPSSDGAIACGVEESCPGGQPDPLVQVGIDPDIATGR